MQANAKKAFYYHTDASALGGVLKQPFERTISNSGSASLAQAGGFSTSKVDDFDLDGIVSFKSARVSVAGYKSDEDGGWRTTATSFVEGLNIIGVLTADRIFGQVSIMHFFDDRPAEISFNGTQFHNLNLNGDGLKPTLAPGIFQRDKERAIPTFKSLLSVADQQYQVVGKGLGAELGPRFAVTDPRTDLERRGSALCSLVDKVDVKSPAMASGHRIHVPDFGNIFLGEILLTPVSAQLTMLRVEMGCVANGTISVASSFSNGRTSP